MPPRKEIWDELTRVWGYAKPVKSGPPSPRDPNRTRKIILKTATITSTITAVIISISVITAFTFINSNSNQANDRHAFNVDQLVLAVDVERLRPSSTVNRRKEIDYGKV